MNLTDTKVQKTIGKIINTNTIITMMVLTKSYLKMVKKYVITVEIQLGVEAIKDYRHCSSCNSEVYFDSDLYDDYDDNPKLDKLNNTIIKNY